MRVAQHVGYPMCSHTVCMHVHVFHMYDFQVDSRIQSTIHHLQDSRLIIHMHLVTGEMWESVLKCFSGTLLISSEVH